MHVLSNFAFCLKLSLKFCSILRSAHSRQGYPSDLLMWGFQKYGGIFLRRKKRLRQCTHKLGASKHMGAHFCGNEKRLRQRTHKLGASRNMGAFFPGKKAPAATYPQVRGFQKYGGLFCGKKSACGNVPTSQGLPKIWGLFLPEKKAPAATYPQVKGFQKFAPLGFRPKNKVFELSGR